ncbi:hypothetical protein CHGG_03528 [Chaetomium globosum CBS 148.51]|uniref:Homeobox domain-containing protein n=1 Tax=Chaetomium globosum (strain ATCC 6205 / CBS 148.51 / DSM 1962 / NBRC 6347 / NRRL 1970) TaxID=306901 RepID=Q2H8C6_CHAGB|nr:uncharacterized protein CHGG_03528 [Chaetomium globosum CBS 148.51]EAQ91593.1 hypothetical protein CHGG_03528 [Chaetomium globosum CBS 148.51]
MSLPYHPQVTAVDLAVPLRGGNLTDNETSKTAKARPKTARHAKGSTRILNEWFVLHSTYPYPTEEEKQILAARTGLTTRQVSFWFVNARRRKTTWGPQCASSASDAPLSLPTFDRLPDSGWEGMAPMDRWRHTPPDQEGASLSAIAEAAERNPHASSAPTLGYYGFDTGEMLSEAHWSISSFGSHHAAIPGSGSDSSVLSHSSGSATSVRSTHSRRRRRRRQRSPVRASSGKSASRLYQCTFCTDTFKTRYDWTRHESTLHLALEKWTCIPSGPTYYDRALLRPRCALCDVLDPSDSHLRSHGSLECASKPHPDRTFYRKDHFRQHLRVCHGVDDILPSMKNWKSHISQIKSRCGFCGESFQLWSARNDHLAEHFRLGARMKSWKGCRGLEPAVALLVENAIPPYLIGIESNDLQPFSASRMAMKGSSTGVASGQVSGTMFEILTARLGDYVRAERERGTVITDDLLRKEARLILFGDDDPWNQTPADNAEWLALFKEGYSLAPTLASCGDVTAGVSLAQQQCWFGPPVCDTNPSPFTLEKMRQATVSSSSFGPPEICGVLLYNQMIHQQEDASLAVPWSWQTPECLAEFSQMCETNQAVMAADPTNDLNFDMVFGEFNDLEQDEQIPNIGLEAPGVNDCIGAAGKLMDTCT